MKKNIIIFIIIAIIVFFAVLFFINFNTSNVSENIGSQNNQQSTYKRAAENISSFNNIPEQVQEKELSVFSTPLAGDENRLENIRISCNTINGTELKNGETFSFNDIVGQPTEEKGYKEADVIIETTLTKGFGGGNCQVSTTLYNACLNTEGIEIIERHPHKRKVTYVEEGKDASVSYGVLDLKFTNNTGKNIKIYMNSENEQVTARIVTF